MITTQPLFPVLASCLACNKKNHHHTTNKSPKADSRNLQDYIPWKKSLLKEKAKRTSTMVFLPVSNHLQAGLAQGKKAADESADNVPAMRLSHYMEMQSWKIDEEANESLFPTEEHALREPIPHILSYSPEVVKVEENLNKISPALVAAQQYFRNQSFVGRSPARGKGDNVFPLIGNTNQ